jgi:hypothetical protein
MYSCCAVRIYEHITVITGPRFPTILDISQGKYGALQVQSKQALNVRT